MRTEEEVRAWMEDLKTYTPISEQQAIGLVASINTCRWVLGEEEGDLG